MQNGELLHPDHGYPVRLLIPGYIGGRMIKWLSKIVVSKEETDNFYHVYDNRLFPPHITSKEVATKEKIWKDPLYRIDDRNMKCVIWSPGHSTKLTATGNTANMSRVDFGELASDFKCPDRCKGKGNFEVRLPVYPPFARLPRR